MKKLYVFAIGGSGERVMRSLVLMLASGMKIGAEELVPVFVDNDENAASLVKCKNIISYYNGDPMKKEPMGAHTLMQNSKLDNKGDFFQTKIAEPILLNQSGGGIGDLKKIIGVPDGGSDDEILTDIIEERNLLFTEAEMKMPLNVGFVGNPNIGSVVLSSINLDTGPFKSIFNSINNDCGVFVVGSLFGGTGASGFPLIVSKFNTCDPSSKPMIGGVALLPYFSTDGINKDSRNILDPKYDVNSASFDTKTRAALMYYDQYMRNMDYMYYVGDNTKTSLPHCIGGEKQDNPADIIEIMAALCAIDFSYQQSKKSDDVCYKIPAWGVSTNSGLHNLSGVPNADLKKSLVKFQMMKSMFQANGAGDGLIGWAIDTKKDYVNKIGFDTDKLLSVASTTNISKSPHSWGVSHLIEEWTKWVSELEKNETRSFSFFNREVEANTQNLTTLFYTNDENGKGIAKLEKEGIFSSKMVAKGAKIAEAMQKAYNDVSNSEKGIVQGMDDSRKLAVMLRIISDAIDIVIKENCQDMETV